MDSGRKNEVVLYLHSTKSSSFNKVTISEKGEGRVARNLPLATKEI